MKKNPIVSIIVSLAMIGLSGGVSFAADKAADTKPAVTTEAKADASPPKAKAGKKKATKKKVAKKAEAKTTCSVKCNSIGNRFSLSIQTCQLPTHSFPQQVSVACYT